MFLQAGHTMPVNVGTTVREFRCRKGDQLVGEEGEEGHGCEAAEAGHRNSLERHVQIADTNQTHRSGEERPWQSCITVCQGRPQHGTHDAQKLNPVGRMV